MRERNRLGTELSALGLARELELENGGDKAAKQREIVLVAGLDFPKYFETGPTKDPKGKCKAGIWQLERAAPDGKRWRQRALNVARIRLVKDPSLVVTLFDFQQGTCERVTLADKQLSTSIEDSVGIVPAIDYRRIELGTRRLIPLEPVCADGHPSRPYVRLCPGVGSIGTGPVGPVDEATWLALAPKNFKVKTSDPKVWGKHGLSIMHAYAYVESIGKKHPGTLAEFHLFGHASSAHQPDSGTAFVNTDDPRSDDEQFASGTRHPLDLDARANLDFLGSTMNVALFAKAFASDAMSFVWGCNWHRPIYAMLLKVIDELKAGKKLDAASTFAFTWSDKGTHGSEDDFRRFFGIDPATWCKQKKTAKPNGKWIRDTLQRLLDDSYMQKLANASGHGVTGGLPATYAEYDDDPKLLKELSHIAMGKRFRKPPKKSQDLTKILIFFDKQFSVPFNTKSFIWGKTHSHPDYGRGFAIYKPKKP